MLVVNLFGAPGSGKSTGAAYIFSQLKMAEVNAELVTEFAKDKVWENNEEVFKNQAYIFGEQSFKMSRCRDKVDVIVTDSPLLLSALYNSDEILGEEFNNVVHRVFNSYENMNLFVERVKKYQPVGRLHTEEEANQIRDSLMSLLITMNVSYKVVDGHAPGYNQIVINVLHRIQKEKNGTKA